MAAGRLPSPGSTDGPCTSPCHHIDCRETLRMAATRCYLCDAPIGFDTPFYDLSKSGDEKLAHAECLDAALEHG